MSMNNIVSITLSDEALQKINEGYQMIIENLPPLVTLSPEERQTIPKMGDKSIAFVNKSLEYAKQNPDIVPSYLNLTEFDKDVNAANQIFQIMAPLQKLSEELDDTALMAGSEAYTTALAFYSVVKAAISAGQTGLKNVYDDLSTRFPGRKKQTAV